MSLFTCPGHYAPAAESLKNRTILITGAGSGLGRSLAVEAAALGANVILLGRTVAKLEKVYDEIEANGSPLAAIYPLDLSGALVEHYQQMVEAIGTEFGQLHNIVHCAASLGPMTPLSKYPATDWQKNLQVNLTGPVFLTQACLGLMTRADSASITFTTDRKSRAYWGAYAIGKAGIESTMQILADEYENVKNATGERLLSINAVAPGPMRTQLRRTAYPGENAQWITPAGHCLANYLYLLDPATDKPNGRVLA